MTWPPYPSYAPTGVAWLGDIPAHWRTRPLWSMFARLKQTGFPDEEMLSVYREHGVVVKDSRDDNLNKTAEDRNIYQLVEPGWLVTNRMKAWQGSVGISSHRGIVSGHYICFRPQHHEDDKYLNWLLRSSRYAGGYQSLSRGVRPSQAEIDNEQLRALTVIVPPTDEQRTIARFLESEVAKIDALIAKQEQLIATLREDRTATVAEAFEGLDAVRLRRLVDPARPMTYGILQCGEPVEDGVPYIGPSDMPGQGQSPPLATLRRTTNDIAAGYRRSVLSGGDVVVSIGPAYGKVAVVDPDLTGANLTQDTVRVAALPSLVDTRYLVWVLLSRQTSQFWDMEITGATFRRLNLGTLALTPVPLPALHEQRRIAIYLDAVTTKVDALISKASEVIETLREFRSALITDAVTGKIDVRGAA